MTPSLFAPGTRFLAGLVALAAASAGCDRSPTAIDRPLLPRPRPPAAEPGADIDAAPAIATEAVDPAPPAGDLQSEMDGFTTLGACIKAHAHLDPLVGDAIEALGYDTLLRDACAIVAAAKARDRRRCAMIEVSSLRERCTATVAEVAGNADGCPWEMPDRPLRGRDPACVAVASRDARLCAAVLQASERAACVAVAAGDPAGCAKLAREADPSRCERGAERWRTVIARSAQRAPFAVAGKLHLEASASDGPTPADVDFTPELERGLVIEEQRGEAAGPAVRLRVGSSLAGSLGDADEDALTLELVVPPVLTAGAPAPVRIERLAARILYGARLQRVVWIRFARASSPGLVVKVGAFERARGGRIDLSIDGVFGDGASAAKGHLELQTFVRDVVRPEDVYSAGEARARDQVGLDAGLPDP